MNPEFQSLCQKLLDPTIETGPILRKLRAIGDFSDDLYAEMRKQVAQQNWPALCRMIHAVFLVVDRKFTDLLCDMLDNHRYQGYMEALADALTDIGDERAVPSLIRALDYYVAGDPDCHFNRKLIVALYRIGTPEALQGIKIASGSPNELIRETAQEFLSRH